MKMKKHHRVISSFTTGLVVFLLVIIIGCGKKAMVSPLEGGASKIEAPLPSPKHLKALKMGFAEDFAILAYSSILSNPDSSINGKVGLLPGTREQIRLDPTEVSEGANAIMGSDDETVPINLLSNAKVDMVLAYKEAVALSPDNDKIGLLEGDLRGKILAPGCYKWNGDLTISQDFIIEGSGSDVWIFKIPAHFKVASDVHLALRGGAKARNIFWQVAGSALLESGSVMAGTIIAQQSVEMKNRSVLTGRAFAKNGYVSLDQAIIHKP